MDSNTKFAFTPSVPWFFLTRGYHEGQENICKGFSSHDNFSLIERIIRVVWSILKAPIDLAVDAKDWIFDRVSCLIHPQTNDSTSNLSKTQPHSYDQNNAVNFSDKHHSVQKINCNVALGVAATAGAIYVLYHYLTNPSTVINSALSTLPLATSRAAISTASHVSAFASNLPQCLWWGAAKNAAECLLVNQKTNVAQAVVSSAALASNFAPQLREAATKSLTVVGGLVGVIIGLSKIGFKLLRNPVQDNGNISANNKLIVPLSAQVVRQQKPFNQYPLVFQKGNQSPLASRVIHGAIDGKRAIVVEEHVGHIMNRIIFFPDEIEFPVNGENFYQYLLQRKISIFNTVGVNPLLEAGLAARLAQEAMIVARNQSLIARALSGQELQRNYIPIDQIAKLDTWLNADTLRARVSRNGALNKSKERFSQRYSSATLHGTTIVDEYLTELFALKQIKISPTPPLKGAILLRESTGLTEFWKYNRDNEEDPQVLYQQAMKILYLKKVRSSETMSPPVKPSSIAEVLCLLRDAAEQGHMPAMMEIVRIREKQLQNLQHLRQFEEIDNRLLEIQAELTALLEKIIGIGANVENDIVRKPFFAEACFHKGLLLINLEKVDEGLQWLKTASDKGNSDASLTLARILKSSTL